MRTGQHGQLNWKDAIIKVLEQSGSALHYKAIAEKIVEQNLRTSLGATPASTVSAMITTDIQELGDKSLFVRTNPGEYLLSLGECAISSTRSGRCDDHTYCGQSRPNTKQ